METGTHLPWISRLFERLGHQVIVANARKVRVCAPSHLSPRDAPVSLLSY